MKHDHYKRWNVYMSINSIGVSNLLIGTKTDVHSPAEYVLAYIGVPNSYNTPNIFICPIKENINHDPLTLSV